MLAWRGGEVAADGPQGSAWGCWVLGPHRDVAWILACRHAGLQGSAGAVGADLWGQAQACVLIGWRLMDGVAESSMQGTRSLLVPWLLIGSNSCCAGHVATDVLDSLRGLSTTQQTEEAV